MICYEFKGGTGTASRMIPVAAVAGRGSSEIKQFAIGVLVQANCGRRPQLTIRGLEVGKKIPGSVYKRETGSIIIVVATDAPLLPHQLKRLARRASLGLAPPAAFLVTVPAIYSSLFLRPTRMPPTPNPRFVP